MYHIQYHKDLPKTLRKLASPVKSCSIALTTNVPSLISVKRISNTPCFKDRGSK